MSRSLHLVSIDRPREPDIPFFSPSATVDYQRHVRSPLPGIPPRPSSGTVASSRQPLSRCISTHLLSHLINRRSLTSTSQLLAQLNLQTPSLGSRPRKSLQSLPPASEHWLETRHPQYLHHLHCSSRHRGRRRVVHQLWRLVVSGRRCRG